jgi:hypothetical protein
MQPNVNSRRLEAVELVRSRLVVIVNHTMQWFIGIPRSEDHSLLRLGRLLRRVFGTLT